MLLKKNKNVSVNVKTSGQKEELRVVSSSCNPSTHTQGNSSIFYLQSRVFLVQRLRIR